MEEGLLTAILKEIDRKGYNDYKLSNYAFCKTTSYMKRLRSDKNKWTWEDFENVVSYLGCTIQMIDIDGEDVYDMSDYNLFEAVSYTLQKRGIDPFGYKVYISRTACVNWNTTKKNIKEKKFYYVLKILDKLDYDIILINDRGIKLW